MSSISNRFFVTALEDGTTLHGNLSADGSLSQAWNGTSAVPDWSIAGNQPTIYLTLLSGSELVRPSENVTWYYNSDEILFDASGTSTSPSGLFKKTTKDVSMGAGASVVMPALKIIGNLANSGNVDVDTITFNGEYIINGTGVDFSATAQIRISSISEGSRLGVINFIDGVSDITSKGQTLTAYGVLYDPDGTQSTDNISTKWYLNDDGTAVNGQTIGNVHNAFQIQEGDVTDHAIVKCEFYNGETLVYTAYAAVDDMQDPEFMYIQYNGNNGNAASLRKGETASFQIWVGTRTDTTPIGGVTNPTYNTIKVKLLDGDGQVITTSGLSTNIPDVTADGYRTLPMSGGKATITPHYDTVAGVGRKNLTGIILAETSV